MSTVYTDALMLGYSQLSETDCIFVRRPFFVIFTMRDIFNNPIPYNDTFAFTSVISADLSLGLFYDNQYCHQYSSEFIDRIRCQFEPLAVGDDQYLQIYHTQTLEMYSGFPISMSVFAFRQEQFRSDGLNSIQKTSDKEFIANSVVISSALSFVAKDMYGFLMESEQICSFYAHTRFILYFSVDFLNPIPQNLVSNISSSMVDTFTPSISVISFNVSVSYPSQMIFDAIYLNYTIYDGLNYKNGLLVKYYSNNNFVGKPLYITRIPSSYIASNQYTSNWYMFHTQFKDFSVKMTTLIFIPKNSGTRLSFVTGLQQRLQIFVDNQIALDLGQTTGSVNIQGDGVWVKVTMLYRYSGNTMNQVVPTFLVQWQTSFLSLQYLENSPTSIVVAMDPDDGNEQFLTRDYFIMARQNFMIKPPIETSYPSTTQIVIQWPAIPEPLSAAEEKIIYYSLEWDQGPIQNWQELTTPGKLVTNYTQLSGFSIGGTYGYRVRAMDLIGYGPYSQVLYVIPKSLPDQAQIPSTVIIGTDVQISWTLPGGNGASIVSQRVFIMMKNGTFNLETTFCNENDTTIFAQQYCLIPMYYLTSNFYQYVKEDLIVAAVSAASFIGYGQISLPNIIGALAESTPLVPGTPQRGNQTSSLILDVNWPAILDNTWESGGLTTTIISYDLQWDFGNPVGDYWFDLMGYLSDSTATSFQTSAGVVGGMWYRVRVRARNKYGWGPFSPIVSIVTALVPGQTQNIQITQFGQLVQMFFSKPATNGLPITQYDIQFRNENGTFNTTASCLGTNPTIMVSLQCSVTFLTLRNDFKLVLNDLIVVEIRAYNSYGWGLYAQNVVGAKIKTEPLKPPYLVSRGVNTNSQLIQYSWIPLTGNYTGGEPIILSYEIYWDSGTNGASFQELYLQVLPFTAFIQEVTDVLPGHPYQFQYRATNQQGTGQFSTPNIIYAADIPSQCVPVVTTNSGTNVIVSWSPPADTQGLPVISYNILFYNQNAQAFNIMTYCNGSKPEIIAALQCIVPMSTFVTPPFNLAIGQLISAIVEASNLIGFSNPSVQNIAGAVYQTKPQVAVMHLQQVGSGSLTTITFSWTGLTDTQDTGNISYVNISIGGAQVDYQVLWNQGPTINSWTTLSSSTLGQPQFTDSTDFQTGLPYQFIVVPFNVYGSGPQSDPITIYTSYTPTGLAPPTTTFDSTNNEIVIEWSPPTDDGGISSLTYVLQVQDTNGNWVTVNQSTECDLTIPLDPGMLGCRMQISDLNGSSYNLVSGQTVIAQVSAAQTVGSVTSTQGGTAQLP